MLGNDEKGWEYCVLACAKWTRTRPQATPDAVFTQQTKEASPFRKKGLSPKDSPYFYFSSFCVQDEHPAHEPEHEFPSGHPMHFLPFFLAL